MQFFVTFLHFQTTILLRRQIFFCHAPPEHDYCMATCPQDSENEAFS